MERPAYDLFDFIEAPLAAGTDGTGCNPSAGSSTACKPGEDPIESRYFQARREGQRRNRARIEKLAQAASRLTRLIDLARDGIIWTEPRSMSWWTILCAFDLDLSPMAVAISSKLGAKPWMV